MATAFKCNSAQECLLLTTVPLFTHSGDTPDWQPHVLAGALAAEARDGGAAAAPAQRQAGLGTSTGCWYHAPNGDMCIVTNKHCLTADGTPSGPWATTVKFVVTRTLDGQDWNEVGEWSIQALLAAKKLYLHPTLDLCALNLTGAALVYSVMPEPIWRRRVESRLRVFTVNTFLPSATDRDDLLERLTTGEPAVMVGYPNNLRVADTNLPVFRRGIAAFPPRLHYRETPASANGVGLLDIGLFSGSSGSPVYVCADDFWTDHKTHTTHHGVIAPALLGVVFAGPTIDSVVDGGTAEQSVAARIHLAMYIKAEELAHIPFPRAAASSAAPAGGPDDAMAASARHLPATAAPLRHTATAAAAPASAFALLELVVQGHGNVAHLPYAAAPASASTAAAATSPLGRAVGADATGWLSIDQRVDQAVHELAAKWRYDARTLPLVHGIAEAGDLGSAVAVRELARTWPDEAATLPLLRRVAMSGKRGAERAVIELAATWPGDAGTRLLLERVAEEGKFGSVEAIKQLADKWRDDAGTLFLLHRIAESGTLGAEIAVNELEARWGNHAGTLPLLQRVAESGKNGAHAAVCMLVTHWRRGLWSNDSDLLSLLWRIAESGKQGSDIARYHHGLISQRVAATPSTPGNTSTVMGGESAATAAAAPTTGAPGIPPVEGAEPAETLESALSWLPRHVLAVLQNPEVSDKRKLQVGRFYAEQHAGSFGGHEGRFVVLHGDGSILPETFDTEELATAAANGQCLDDVLLMRVGGASISDSRIFYSQVLQHDADGMAFKVSGLPRRMLLPFSPQAAPALTRSLRCDTALLARCRRPRR
jgi:hypothetical protein